MSDAPKTAVPQLSPQQIALIHHTVAQAGLQIIALHVSPAADPGAAAAGYHAEQQPDGSIKIVPNGP